MDLVSIIIPTFNRKILLLETLNSVFRQTYRPLEIIIIDDGSVDQTAESVKPLIKEKASDLTVKYFYQTNLGPQIARNQGTKIAQGSFIQYLDSDDLLEPEKIETQVKYFSKNKFCDIVYGDWTVGCEYHKAVKMSMGPVPDMVEALLLRKFNPPFCYLIKKPKNGKKFFWNEKLKINEDFEFFLNLAISGFQFVYEPGLNGWYRKHAGPRVSEQSTAIWAETTLKIISDAEKALKEKNYFSKNIRRALADYYFFIGKSKYKDDKSFFYNMIAEMKRLDKNFIPGKFYEKFLRKFFGYCFTEWLRAKFKK